MSLVAITRSEQFLRREGFQEVELARGVSGCERRQRGGKSVWSWVMEGTSIEI